MTPPEHAFLRQCYPTGGDWFAIYTPDQVRWFIERVLLWGLVEAEHQVSHVSGILTDGLPADDTEGDRYYVLGSDRSPAGTTWREVFDGTLPTIRNVREITEMIRPAQAKQATDR
jgi:hypothetical protein